MPGSPSTQASDLPASQPRASTVAVVGLGRMGGRIARRLLETGHRVIVWNRSWDRASRLLELGAVPAVTPADAASRAEVLITMVSDPPALRAVTEGPTGIAAGAGASTTVVEMSAVGPMAIRRLASVLPPAAALLDAPVLGSLREAESGSLTIFVGGPRRCFDLTSPVLSALGTANHVGPLGAGAAAVRLGAAAAAWLAEAERLGLGDRDCTAVLEAILRRTGAHPAVPRSPERPLPAASGGEPDCDGLIVDLDGVVWRGGDPIDGAAEAIAALREKGTRVLFLTNDPGRSRSSFAARLTEIGIPAAPADVMTSAAAIGSLLRSLTDLTGGAAYVVGPPALHDEVRAAGLRLLAEEDARHADVVVVGGHEGFDHGELCAATAALRGGARLFATSRDAVLPGPDGLRPATGAILAAIEAAGGALATVVGKPDPAMFQVAREALAGCRHVGVVGDHLVADIAGAKRAGLRAILVLTGVAARADLERAVVEPDSVFESLAAFAETMSTG